jgi:hypothetical protein
VLSRTADGVVVETRRLTWDGTALGLGDPAAERIAPDHVLVAAAAGDTVALHWEWLCDRLAPDRAADLERTTRHHLTATTHRLSRE